MCRYLTTNDQEASRLLAPSMQLLMRLLSKISLANTEVVTTRAVVMQLYCALLAENVRTEDDVDDMQVLQPYLQHPITTHSFQAAGFTEIFTRAINSYGVNEGCAHWLMRALSVPLGLSQIVRVEFLNLGGLISTSRLLELHPSSRDVAAAVVKCADNLLDDPSVKIEIKKKVRCLATLPPLPPPQSFAPLPNKHIKFDLISQGELVMRIRNIPKVLLANIELINFQFSSYSVHRTLRGFRRKHSPSTILASKNWLLVSNQNPIFPRSVFSHSKLLFVKITLGAEGYI
jgi:hypothetical protein